MAIVNLMNEDAQPTDTGTGSGLRMGGSAYGYGNGLTQPLGPIAGSASAAYATNPNALPMTPPDYQTNPSGYQTYYANQPGPTTGGAAGRVARGVSPTYPGGVNQPAGPGVTPSPWTPGTDPMTYFTAILNNGAFQTPQAAIDYFNGQNIPGYGYGASPMYQASTDTIGLPTGYYAKNPQGQWGWVDRVEGQPSAGAAAPPSSYSPSSVFDDPATKPFIDLLNSRIATLMGPAYTPQQLALMNTQAFDPLMSARDTQRQNIINWGASHGMGPTDGPVQQLLQQNDLQYQRLGTQAQGQVGLNAINQQNQNQNLAVSLAQIIPQMAWSRLQGASNAVQPINPLTALSMLNNFQTQGATYGSDFASSLMQIVPYLTQFFG